MTDRIPDDAQSAQVSEAMLEAGAQALADDVWHPPIKLAQMAGAEATKFRRHALIALKAALAAQLPAAPAAPVEPSEHPVLKHADELHELGFNAGWNGAVEECAKIADLSGDSAMSEKGRDMATGIAAAIRARIEPPPRLSAENVDAITTLMIRDMFADHELPVDEAVFHKYEDLARKILIHLRVEPQAVSVWKPIETAPKGPTISVARKGGQRDDGSTYWYQAIGHYDPNLGHFHKSYGELYGEPELWAQYPENPERCPPLSRPHGN